VWGCETVDDAVPSPFPMEIINHCKKIDLGGMPVSRQPGGSRPFPTRTPLFLPSSLGFHAIDWQVVISFFPAPSAEKFTPQFLCVGT